MNKLMMTVGSLALMAMATPVLAQTSNGPASTPPSATMPGAVAPTANPAPKAMAPDNSSTSMPQDTGAPMSSRNSTSAVSPAQGDTSSSADSASRKPMKMSHHAHHSKQMGSTKASGSKSTDNDAERLNQQELGKLQSPN